MNEESLIITPERKANFKPSHPKCVIAKLIEPKFTNGEVKLALPAGVLYGYLNPFTDDPVIEVLAVSETMTEDIRVGDTCILQHLMDKIPIDKIDYPDVFQVPEECIVAILNRKEDE